MAADLASDSGPIPTGEYKPTNYGANDPFDAPAPAGPYGNPAPAGTDTFESVFGTDGSGLNGDWKLYLDDDLAGFSGTVGGGWKITFESADYTCSVGPVVAEESRADFDGDGRSDLSVFRPSEGNWYLQQSTAGFTAFNWGIASDTLVPGDYDGDGKADAAVFRPTDSAGVADFYILNSNGFTFAGYEWGSPGDIPVVGDYDNDDKTDVAVYRPSSGDWYVITSSDGGNTIINWGGQPGDVPLVADWNGDGKTDFSFRRGTVWMATLTGGGTVNVDFGLAGDLPVQADYDGDDRDDIAVWRPSDGTWRYIRSSDSMTTVFTFGATGDIPVPGDYDGDGTDDQAVYRNGTWYLNQSTNGFFAAPFGLAIGFADSGGLHPVILRRKPHSKKERLIKKASLFLLGKIISIKSAAD